MRLFGVIVLLALLSGGQAFAQLDKILAPVVFAAAPSSQLELEAKQARELEPAKAPLHALTIDEILPRLQQQLTDRYSLEGELKLEMNASMGRILVPPDYDLTIVDYPGGGLTNTFVVRCKLIGNGKTLADFQLPLRAQLWREVWVADGRLDRGQALDRSLLTAQKIDVLREHDTLLGTEFDPALYDLAQSVQPGRPLTRRDVAARPVIHKGAVVDVIARQGGFAIRMKALALENGITRDLIKMRNLESHKDFTAEVIDENQVEVHF